MEGLVVQGVALVENDSFLFLIFRRTGLYKKGEIFAVKTLVLDEEKPGI